jgi:hypothetical protein
MNKQMCKWSKNELENKNFGMRVCKRFTDATKRYDGAFKKSCAFFDPSVQNGGPNPDESTHGKVERPNGKWVDRKIRSRREAADNYSKLMKIFNGKDIFADDWARSKRDTDTQEETYGFTNITIDAEDEENMEDCDGSESGALAAFCDMGDYFDVETEHDDRVRGKKGGKKRVKLNKNQKKLKKITVTMAKWCNWYIYDCHGQRVHKFCESRSLKMFNSLMNKAIGAPQL